MNRILLLIAFCLTAHLSRAAEYVESPVETGKSPDGQMDVVNIHDGEGGYFVIRNNSNSTIFSEKSLNDEFGDQIVVRPSAAQTVLWRPDSRFVAIAFPTYTFAVETVVFFREDGTLRRIAIPEYSRPHVEVDRTHCEPYRWLKNGDLVLKITTGYSRLGEGTLTQYFATVQIRGNPPKASKGSQTKPKSINQ